MSIPASRIVSINPSALGTGGNPLAVNTLLIVDGPQRTLGVAQFGSAAEVGTAYGLTSPEYQFASRYFVGYDGSTRIPGALYVVEQSDSALTAILRGASVKSISLAQLKLIKGDLIVSVGGNSPVTVPLDFANVTSFSEAAAMLTDTSTFVGDFNEQLQAFEITTVLGGNNTSISFGSGEVGVALKLTQAAGAQTAEGRNALNFTELMAFVTNKVRNFAVITHINEQDRAAKEAAAEWTTLQKSRFAYVAQDTDGTAVIANSAANFGAWLAETSQNGTTPYYGTIEQIAALCGGIASINFKATNGRRNIMFMKQAGIAASVSDETTYTALLSNGYTFYGAFSTANDNFTFTVNGRVSGQFKWLDNYINQVYMNSQFELAMITMLLAYGSIPYNDRGKAIHRAAAMDPINEMINFGGIVPLEGDESLSEQQKSIINTAAGFDVVPNLLAKGWVLVIGNADAQTRGNRGAFPFNFWYTDGGSVQSVEMASINVQ